MSEIIKPGQYCEISLPEVDGAEFTGQVEEILAGNAPFALQGGSSDADAAPQVFVRVAAENYDPQTMSALQPGMKAEVRIDPERMAAPPPAPAQNSTAP